MKVVSLFAGAGGLDLGMVKAGHEVVWANDIDKDSCETYRLNIGNHIVCEDITQTDFATIPSADVIIGGFPCQGFSMANLLRNPEDSRNTLYKYFYKLVKEKQPRYFLAENVRGILSLDKGEVIKQIVKDFKRAGYRVDYQVFNTANYGVPQTRVRVIIAGTRKDLPKDLDYEFPEPTHDKKDWISIGAALEDVPEPESKHSLLNHICSQYKVTNRNFTGHRTTNPDKPSPTILARGNGKGGVCALQHPQNHRRMSVRESSLIQTFPIDFEFTGSMTSMYRQIGNAVPIKFAEKLGQKLAELEEVEA
jgi:DNA (cytosine-5)-methyltransferase 1